MDKIEFLGEVDPLLISGGFTPRNTHNAREWIGGVMFDPRISLINNIPFSEIDLKTLTCSFKVEYLHMDYNLPSLDQIPQSELELLSNRRDSTVAKQVKTANFKRKYNPLTNYAVEINLFRSNHPSYGLNGIYGTDYSKWRTIIKRKNYNNEDVLLLFPAEDRASLFFSNNDVRFSLDNSWQVWGGYANLTGSTNLEGYPINEYLYNGGLPGFLDLMPYLIKNGNLIFSDLDHIIYLFTDITKLGNNDLILINGGYSGTAYFKERVRKIIKDITPVINATNTVTQVLPETPKRALIYLTNNTTKKLYFSFSNAVTLQSPYINPGGNLVWEHGEVVNLDGDTGLLQKYDKRSIFGLPLFVKSELGATGTVTCEQYVYDY
jgi:hypothetical protein